jgi:prepilin-type N-terminal cleavage/methylation domain-containing protein
VKRPRRLGFTLIEVLVVVAIIALLVAILLPSLSRAKGMARMTQCQSNMKQLATAFATYATEYKGRLPGQNDTDADWLGHYNTTIAKRLGLANGRNPDDGTVYKYMGKNKLAYVCPDDTWERGAGYGGPQDSKYSYTTNTLVDGAPVEVLSGAHYRRSSNPTDSLNYSTTNHTANMRPFDGVPVIIEEDPDNYLKTVNDSGWGNDDCIAARHLPSGSNPGYGNLSYHDTHVGRVQLVPRVAAKTGPWFTAESMCVRVSRHKWVSALNVWDGFSYGGILKCKDAASNGVTH